MNALLRRTKIVATLGPASDSEQVLREMIRAGLDVVRINFSHANPENTLPTIGRVRAAADSLGVPIALLGDLRGPRIRVGEMQGGKIELPTGGSIVLTPEDVVGTPEKISVSFAGLAGDVRLGERVLLESTLRDCQWNKTRAAERLGVSPKTLLAKIRAVGLEE